jgi:hypothetical protein
LKKQLKEFQENRSNADVKINNLLANMQALQEEKNSLEMKLIQKQTGYQTQVNFLLLYIYIFLFHN